MKIMHINCYYKKGSTGKIIEEINKTVMENGGTVGICFSKSIKSLDSNAFKISSRYELAVYKRIAKLIGLEYYMGLIPTLKIMFRIKQFKPNIVHLHSANGFMLNYYILMKYLKKLDIKVVLTNHAEFYYTGNCSHSFECDKWKTGCGNCPNLFKATGSKLFDSTKLSWKWTKKNFELHNQINVVSVSKWVNNRSLQSPILNKFPHQVILNGIDTNKGFYLKNCEEFKNKIGLSQKKILLHVTASFTDDIENSKGGHHILELAAKLQHNSKIVFLVIASYAKVDKLPSNVIVVKDVNDIQLLNNYYNIADLSIITSKKETFSMPVAESLATGTPVIGFKAGGPESISLKDYSEFVEYGDLDSLVHLIYKWYEKKQEIKEGLSNVARNRYSSEIMSLKYYQLYKSLL
ncbi:glycosyltransferase [Chryseomicrobium imtechense]